MLAIFSIRRVLLERIHVRCATNVQAIPVRLRSIPARNKRSLSISRRALRARPHDSIWLAHEAAPPRKGSTVCRKFTRSVDAKLLGCETFDLSVQMGWPQALRDLHQPQRTRQGQSPRSSPTCTSPEEERSTCCLGNVGCRVHRGPEQPARPRRSNPPRARVF